LDLKHLKSHRFINALKHFPHRYLGGRWIKISKRFKNIFFNLIQYIALIAHCPYASLTRLLLMPLAKPMVPLYSTPLVYL